MRAAFLLLMLTVVACSYSPSGPYKSRHDGAPRGTINPEDVADAIPRADPILTAGNKTPYTVNGVTYEILPDASGYKRTGTASWYGTKFHGHKTSNGEIYDLYKATAAHKTLPIPSYVRVTNLENLRSIVVRVNDRGPFHPDRIIDLSYAAALKLGYADTGTAPVEVELIDVAGVDDRRQAPVAEYRYLQVGAFGAESSAQRLQVALADTLPSPVFISPVQAGGSLLYRVRVGPVNDKRALREVQRKLVDLGYEPGQPLP